MKTYQIPDSKAITLVQDINKKVDLSTFLDDGQSLLNMGQSGSILLKMGQRFMHFTQNGKFISEVEFGQDTDEWHKRIKGLIAGAAIKVKKRKAQSRKSVLRRAKNLTGMISNQADIMTDFVKTTNLHLKLGAQKQKHMELLQMSDDS